MTKIAYWNKNGNIQFRKSKNAMPIGIVQEVLPNGDFTVLARYTEDKGEPQMEVCELEE